MNGLFFPILSILVIILFTGLLVFTLNKYIKKVGWVKDLIITITVASILRWGFFEISTVPTGSMEGTILPGDFTFVSKLHFGPRTPQTLLQIPLTQQKTHLLGIKSYLNWLKIPSFRFWGFTKIKRGDVVVFNNPNEKGVNMDMKTFYVKRCMGLPGESIEVRENDVFINGKNVDKNPNRLIHFFITPNKILNNYWFNKNNIREYYKFGNDYVISTTLQNIEEIKKQSCIKAIEVCHEKRDNIFISDAPHYQDNSNWGPILIPRKGLEIEINDVNFKIYNRAIELDSKGKIKINGKNLIYKGEKIKKYTFQQDHYFMIGDNRYNSVDSRFWGFVPEDHIYAKTICILFSKNPDSWFSGLSFKRTFNFL